ncbi:hypothetical protein ACQZ44_11825 [Agrobacterium vitis]
MPANETYEITRDNTLTPQQRSARSFLPVGHKKGELRGRSGNKTINGYNTGFHEGAVTTSLYRKLHELPDNRGINGNVRQWLLKHADGFRSDTAQTILSIPIDKVVSDVDGKPILAAGHPGSNIKQSGKNFAHELLNEKVIELLKTRDKTPWLTEESVVTIMGAIMLASIAPGEVARTLNTSELTARHVKQTWEERRNEAKLGLNKQLEALNRAERAFVSLHAGSFLGRLGRTLATNRASSPLRNTKAPDPRENGVQGGGLDRNRNRFKDPKRALPGIEQFPYYLTENFRTEKATSSEEDGPLNSSSLGKRSRSPTPRSNTRAKRSKLSSQGGAVRSLRP